MAAKFEIYIDKASEHRISNKVMHHTKTVTKRKNQQAVNSHSHLKRPIIKLSAPVKVTNLFPVVITALYP